MSIRLERGQHADRNSGWRLNCLPVGLAEHRECRRIDVQDVTTLIPVDLDFAVFRAQTIRIYRRNKPGESFMLEIQQAIREPNLKGIFNDLGSHNSRIWHHFNFRKNNKKHNPLCNANFIPFKISIF